MAPEWRLATIVPDGRPTPSGTGQEEERVCVAARQPAGAPGVHRIQNTILVSVVAEPGASDGAPVAGATLQLGIRVPLDQRGCRALSGHLEEILLKRRGKGAGCCATRLPPPSCAAAASDEIAQPGCSSPVARTLEEGRRASGLPPPGSAAVLDVEDAHL